MVEWRIDGTTSVDVDADLNRRRDSMSATLWSSLARYGGAVECRQWYVSTASLNQSAAALVASVSRGAADSRPHAFWLRKPAEQQRSARTAAD